MTGEIEKLGHYEIVATLGAGANGQVYRARDTRLGRDVAVKVVLPEFAGSAEFLQRFQREGKIVAGLNHPNICRLYDIGEQDNLHYLVMELLEGETLASRLLSRGPSSVDEVLRAGIEIADGLYYAHQRGDTSRFEA